MNLYLDMANSAEFWRRVYPIDRVLQPAPHMSRRPCAYSEKDVCLLAPPWADEDFLNVRDGLLHVLVFEPNQRRRTKRHVTHLWSGPLPDGSFYSLSGALAVASPAFMFLQAATQLSMPALIAFGCELCGRYSFDPTVERGFRTRDEPLLSQKQLGAFLAGAKNCRGWRLATSALPYVIGQSASPMETFDALAKTVAISMRFSSPPEREELTSRLT